MFLTKCTFLVLFHFLLAFGVALYAIWKGLDTLKMYLKPRRTIMRWLNLPCRMPHLQLCVQSIRMMFNHDPQRLGGWKMTGKLVHCPIQSFFRWYDHRICSPQWGLPHVCKAHLFTSSIFTQNLPRLTRICGKKDLFEDSMRIKILSIVI